MKESLELKGKCTIVGYKNLDLECTLLRVNCPKCVTNREMKWIEVLFVKKMLGYSQELD